MAENRFAKYARPGVVASAPPMPKAPIGFRPGPNPTVAPGVVQGQAQIAGAEAAARGAVEREIAAFKTQQDLVKLQEELRLKREADKPQPLSPEAMQSARLDAMDKIALARRLRSKSSNDWFATGFLANTMSNFGGTPATTVKAGAGTLRSGGAIANILKATQANGGKNPFTPMSNSDVDLIANNTANLDIGQQDSDFQQAVGLYEDAYRNAYIGAGGDPNKLDAEIEARARFLAKQQGRASGPRVIKYDANGRRVK